MSCRVLVLRLSSLNMKLYRWPRNISTNSPRSWTVRRAFTTTSAVTLMSESLLFVIKNLPLNVNNIHSVSINFIHPVPVVSVFTVSRRSLTADRPLPIDNCCCWVLSLVVAHQSQGSKYSSSTDSAGTTGELSCCL